MGTEATMELLSAEYGWTPRQIRELTYHEVNSYLKIISIKRTLEEKRTKYGR